MPIRPNPTLPEDLIGEILVRVPVKSLLCFQLVCKAWLSLIKESAFVKSQLFHAIKTQTHQALIYNSLPTCRSQKEKFSVLDVDSRQILADLKSPYSKSKPVANCTLVGSVNGIVCLNVFIPAIEERNVCLWNPATRQSKLFPLSLLNFHPSGFGYDPIDDDYKVVMIGILKRYSVKVYLPNRDVWGKVPDPIYIPYPDKILFNVCINGFLCGIQNHGIDNRMMVVFDLHKELLNCAIKLPVIIRDVHHDGGGDDDEDEDYHETCIAEFNKSIAVIKLRDKGQNDGQKINMWMLNDIACLGGGGYEASWTPMFSIDLAVRAQLFLGYFNNRDLLVLTRDMWISCNVDKKEAKIVPLSVEMASHCCGIIVHKYTESLVSLRGFKQINWNASEDDNLGNTVDFDISVNPADFDIFVPEWLE